MMRSSFSPSPASPAAAPSSPAPADAAVARLVQLYEHLSTADLARLDEFYAAGAEFKDPFNEVRGVPAIRQVFEHMFATLDRPRFVVTQTVVQEAQAFLVWEFHFRLRRWRPGVDQCVRGGSLLRFDADGRVMQHRDYWDAAEELYEKIPVLGTLMRWLRGSGAAPQSTPVSPHADRSPS